MRCLKYLAVPICGFAAGLLALPSSSYASTITFSSGLFPSGTVSTTSASITGTNISLASLVYDSGAGPVTYDLDGSIDAVFPAGDTLARLEFFIDGCTAPIPTFGLNCIPTRASYIEIVGSVPGLGLTSQQLLVGNFVGGAADRATGASPFFTISGGGFDTKSLALLQALGIDPATEWQFEMTLVPIGTDSVTNTAANAATAVPEPSGFVLLATGLLAVAVLRRRRL